MMTGSRLDECEAATLEAQLELRAGAERAPAGLSRVLIYVAAALLFAGAVGFAVYFSPGMPCDPRGALPWDKCEDSR